MEKSSPSLSVISCFLYLSNNWLLVRLFQFHDREEIRRRLASDSDSEDTVLTSGFRSSRKSSLVSRLQSGQSLQICFMNEAVTDSSSHVSIIISHANHLVWSCGQLQANNCYETEINKLDNESRSGNNLDNKCKRSPNNNSCLDINKSLDSLSISKTNPKRPNYLFTKLGFTSLDKTDLDKNQLFCRIEKPTRKELFAEYHTRLHAEARLALAQVCQQYRAEDTDWLCPVCLTYPLYRLERQTTVTTIY